MIIALDFDSTYTLDPPTWDKVVDVLQSHGHTVHCVTCRRDTAENREIVKVPGVLTYFTWLGPKLDYMKKWGIKVDVWIEDDPVCVLHGK